ncbi:MAG: alpha/beta hydrolase [Gemmatimonadetes bacterium]|jgi:uncharacterized protein|nr:alpha/beta hydrolase [Gemmatimonadota bacterium]
MRQFILVTAILLAVCTCTGAQPATFPRYSIFNTEIRFLYSAEVGRMFKLFINLPRDYQVETDRQYPSLYMVDPAAHFGMMTDIQRLLEDGKDIEPILTVGVGYETIVIDSLIKYRTIDLTPTETEDGTGGAESFLRFFETELIPFIEAEYRVDPSSKGIWGGSYGGLFGTYALLTKPDLFDRYMLNSPVPGYGDGVMFRLVEALGRRRDSLDAKVYFAVGGEENPDWIIAPTQKLAGQLTATGIDGLEVEVDVVAGETHASIGPIGITRGLMRMYPRSQGWFD